MEGTKWKRQCRLTVPQHLQGVDSFITIGKETVTLLIGAVEEEIGLEPLGVANEVASDETHEALAGLGTLGNYPDLAADHVHLLVHVPIPGEAAAPSGLPHRPPVDAKLRHPLPRQPSLHPHVVHVLQRPFETRIDPKGPAGGSGRRQRKKAAAEELWRAGGGRWEEGGGVEAEG